MLSLESVVRRGAALVLFAVMLCGGVAWGTNTSKLPAGANHARAHQAPHSSMGNGIHIGVLELNTGIAAANSNLGGRLQGQFDYAAMTPSQIGAVNPIVVAGVGSTHTSLVANTAAGSANGAYIGVAPMAEIYVGGVGTNVTTALQDFNALRLATMDLLSNHNVYVYNSSYDFDVPNNAATNGNDNPALYVDWFQNRFDALFIQAAGNNGNGFGDGTNQFAQPGTMFNGIVVGSANGNARRASSSYWSPGDNGTAPDQRGLPHILAPGSSIWDGTTQDGGGANQVQSGTSFAAPHVAGTAALLMDNGLGLPGPANRNHLAIKALIMNSARKRNIVQPENTQASSMDHANSGMQASDRDYLDGGLLRAGMANAAPHTGNWTPSNWSYIGGLFVTNNPLDDEQGVGLLDAERALINMDAGEQGPGAVGVIGWNRDAAINGQDDVYQIDHFLKKGDFITATLVWDRIVNEIEDGGGSGDDMIEDNDSYAHGSLVDLDLEIWYKDLLIAESVSTTENVEHLHIPVPIDGAALDFSIHVEHPGGALTHYGLAWWTVPEPTSFMILIICASTACFRRR